jgi:hypothetical protein
MQYQFARKPAGSLLSNARLSMVSCHCERRARSAQKLHNNPEFLPGSAEQTANKAAINGSLQREVAADAGSNTVSQ